MGFMSSLHEFNFFEFLVVFLCRKELRYEIQILFDINTIYRYRSLGQVSFIDSLSSGIGKVRCSGIQDLQKMPR